MFYQITYLFETSRAVINSSGKRDVKLDRNGGTWNERQVLKKYQLFFNQLNAGARFQHFANCFPIGPRMVLYSSIKLQHYRYKFD